MKRVGVTGAAGFIGSNLCERLLADGYEVVGVDDLSYGSVANVAAFMEHPSFTFEVLDCTQRAAAAARPSTAATRSLTWRRRRFPRFGGTLSTLEVNVGGVHAACDVALDLDAELVITSTSDVYGNATPPFREDDELVIGPPTTKRWAYAVSKMYDEHVALALADEKDLRVTILRLFNVYGPKNHLSWWGGPVVTFIESLLDGEPMEIHGDGQQTRTFTYVDDTVDGIVRALERPESRGEVINLGGVETLTILELAQRCQEMLGAAGAPLRANFITYESLPGKYQDVRHRVPDTSKAERLLGFRTTVDFAEGLARTVEWHRACRDSRRRSRASTQQAMVRTTRRTTLLRGHIRGRGGARFAAHAEQFGPRCTRQDGEWSAPIAWPIVAVHMSLEPTGEVFALDGFDDAVNSERLWNPTTSTFQVGSLRPQPLLLRARPAPGRPDADRRRAHQRLRRSQRHDALQRRDEHVLPGRRHGRVHAGIPP